MKRNDDGFILAEILAAMVLILIIISGISSAFEAAFSTAVMNGKRTEEIIRMENSFSGVLYGCVRGQ